jgi:hypothetical protein
VASAKQLKGRLDKLKEQIEQRQTQLATLRETQKDVRAQLAEAKKASKGKPKSRKGK